MSTIMKQDDDVVSVIAPATHTSGTPIRSTSLFGVPEASVASGSLSALRTSGVQALPKSGSGSVNFAVGDRVYWSGSLATATTTDNCVGVCITAAGNSATTVDTMIDGFVHDSGVTGTATISSGQSAVVVTVGTGYNAKPVQVTLKTSAGALHATLPIGFKAIVAAGDLTITSVELIGGATTAVASNVILYYHIAPSA